MQKKQFSSLSRLTETISGDKLKALNLDSVNAVIKKKLNDFEDAKERGYETKKAPSEKGITHGYSQDYIPLKRFINGMIHTADNRYLSVIEVFPINYYKEPAERQDRVIDSFERIFVNCPAKMSLKIMADTSNPIKILEHMQETWANTTNIKIRESLNDVINKIIGMSENNTIIKRYFITFEYSGDGQGKRSYDVDEIGETMADIKAQMIMDLGRCGNICYTPENENRFLGEYVYYFFNRKTYYKESFAERIERVNNDYEIYNETAEKKKKPQAVDYISPKGLYLDSRNYMFMDGSYYTFLVIKTNSYPSETNNVWMDWFTYGAFCDVDIFVKKLPKQTTDAALSQLNKFTLRKIKENANIGRNEKANALTDKYVNVSSITNAFKAGHDLFNVCIMLTLRADTASHLMRMKKIFTRYIKQNIEIEVDDCFNRVEEHFKMAMPFLFLTAPFRQNSHNMIPSALATLYPFTQYSLNDEGGFVIGKAKDYNSLAIVNNFNTKKYSNGSIAIFGSPGAGKTFTQLIIGESLTLNGVRTFYIIPKKGHEYEGGCKAIGGTYIRLMPGSNDCVNICEIRPEGQMDVSLINDDEVTIQAQSLRAKKITNIIIWLNLLCSKDPINSEELNKLNVCLTRMYEKFGITDMNDSIYENRKERKLKQMPTIGDIYKEVSAEPTLKKIEAALEPFITGSYKHLNGPTNVNTDNPYIVFNVDVDVIGDDMLASYLYIAFSYCYDAIKESPLTLDVIFLDEYWKMLETEDSAKQVQNFVKIIRGYGGAAILSTQEIGDCTQSKYGRSILNGTSIKFILRVEENELKFLKEELNLRDQDLYEIADLKHQGMFIAGRDKVIIDIIASDRELRAFNTDPNLRIKWAAEEEKKKQNTM